MVFIGFGQRRIESDRERCLDCGCQQPSNVHSPRLHLGLGEGRRSELSCVPLLCRNLSWPLVSSHEMSSCSSTTLTSNIVLSKLQGQPVILNPRKISNNCV